MTSKTLDGWEIVIGLEVHAELATATKLFSSAQNVFGGEPNTNIDPVSLGLPGSLPVLNQKAVELAIRVGLALNCRVQRSVFARKNYFYPDMPKAYQISQFDLPINEGGWLELPDGQRIGIERAHLEEDTGKSSHVGGGGRIHEADYSLVDYNRAGVPLIEIVGAPDLRSAEEARSYVSELRSILVAIGASDGKMEEGSMRVDCNVSVRPEGSEEFGTRCEVKNINSLRSLGRAIEYEAQRQVDIITSGQEVEQQTRHWDEADGRTHTLRSKEEAFDYRYFPEPDLVPLDPSPEWITEIQESLPELPRQRRINLAEAAGITPQEATLVVERNLDEFAIAVIEKGADPTRVLVHLENNLADGIGELTTESFAELISLETSGDLSATQAKTVLADLADKGGDPKEIAAHHGFEAMDTSELETLIEGILADHPEDWTAFVEGDPEERKKKSGFFVGQVMKMTKGQADGKVVNDILLHRAES
ncbi:MAG: Asp-tRNA(Asn)/Glu-tRNA(Gln) amidotransferase subunit GatB [Actinomycetota bacterium]|jgi:aspartyl-tRNA(Asn)/glutamyl-tRNA(Gln) amidotransferase subunit B|nr:Asp-tRNA(Asn)/Glu-tRNA(Gln) amidotransferase subunit GatB [Actinomycetota bacterium]MEE2646655.1 Asp-tRNA(Asn)/Glu-tRNA(Gln) amidotransferase subunit GatB [Actinomycetota bacterium]|tara:strand:- start:246 stop:1679 length:1434 start_codon:yes stop_codon:yes gene_type:complete